MAPEVSGTKGNIGLTVLTPVSDQDAPLDEDKKKQPPSGSSLIGDLTQAMQAIVNVEANRIGQGINLLLPSYFQGSPQRPQALASAPKQQGKTEEAEKKPSGMQITVGKPEDKEGKKETEGSQPEQPATPAPATPPAPQALTPYNTPVTEEDFMGIGLNNSRPEDPVQWKN